MKKPTTFQWMTSYQFEYLRPLVSARQYYTPASATPPATVVHARRVVASWEAAEEARKDRLRARYAKDLARLTRDFWRGNMRYDEVLARLDALAALRATE